MKFESSSEIELVEAAFLGSSNFTFKKPSNSIDTKCRGVQQ